MTLSMRIIHDLENFHAPWDSSILTLGVFDGMHRGHLALMKRLHKRHGGKKARILVTYYPHPDVVLGKHKEDRIGELFTYQEKISLLQRYNLDAVVFLKFTRKLANLSAEEYLDDVLVGALKASHIIIGYDQTFGKERRGNFQFLQQKGPSYGFTVEQVKEVRSRGEIISSSLIRRLVRAGEISHVNRLLGHPYFVSGVVIRGEQKGRDLGFPTINLDIPEGKLIPGVGVYAGYATRGSETYRAMINIGWNPTFDRGYLCMEAHLLGFQGDMYGAQVRIYFLKKIRNERKFPSVDELIKRLKEDRRVTERVKLPTSHPLSALFNRFKS